MTRYSVQPRDLIGNQSADEIILVSRTSSQNSFKTVKNDYDEEIPKEKYISPEERSKVIDDLRLI